MGLDNVKRIADVSTPQGAAVLQEVLSNIHQQAISFIYTDTVPTKLDFGKVAVYDDGAGTQRIYIKTAQENIVSVALT
jgi:hypothetical protein